MAISVSFGLLVITAVILILLPVYLILLNRFKVYTAYAWNGVKPKYKDVEAAIRKETGYEFLWYVLFAAIAIGVLASFLS